MGLCPYARAFMAEVAGTGEIDAAVFATTCDQMRRAAEWVARARQDQGRAVFLMNVPATWQTPASARMYRDELLRLGRFLVSLGGTAPSREHLAETMEAYDAQRAVSLDPYMFRVWRAVNPLPLRERVAEGRVRGCRGSTPYPQPLSHEGRGVSSGILNTHPDPPRAKPVAIVGGPLMRGDERIFQTVADAGGRAVLDGTESGPRTLPAPFDRRRIRDDPLMELVDAYFGAIPDAFRRPDTLLYQWLERELAASGARGIIVWRYVWCDMWAAAAARLRETTGLPVLDFDVSGDEAAAARTDGRIQAFLEVLT
jgi:benzoyl-CoA reductase/2-hydroxyglutaryl-CoA dehydratase subunit BcrC/BadD/HgdB